MHGHYGANVATGATLQGIYCATPSGEFLASINSNNPAEMAGMLRRALVAWQTLPRTRRLQAEDPAEQSIARAQIEQFPEDGLLLRCTVRDLPRDTPNATTWWGQAWNQDNLWLRADEALALMPRELKKGATLDWPEHLARRLVRFNLVDFVRGQTTSYASEQVHEAWLRTEVVKTKRNKWVELRFTGGSRASTGTWPGEGLQIENPAAGSRGLGTQMRGSARFDFKTGRFTEFELVAVGVRWGQTDFNFRENDHGPAGIAFVFRLAERDDPQARVAPAFLWEYGW